MSLWGGRLGETGGREAGRFTAAIGFDRRLWREDIAGSRAHARMLARVGVLEPAEAQVLVEGLDRVAAEIESGTFPFRTELEDIHLNIERRLTELVGPVGGKLHTGRSRNDQVALDMHLYVKRVAGGLGAAVGDLQTALVERAAEYADAPMPGYTHLQHAQPVLFGHHLLAYFFMLERDRERLEAARCRADRSPLGAAALAGSSFPLDAEWVAAELGLGGTYPNSLDAVSDRDFVLDLLTAGAVLHVHLSRLAEELVLWSTREFGYIEPDDAFATGSSIMPQKKNPDVAELVRGKAGRVIGNLVGLLTTLKGLPLAYHSDLQEDKEALFDTVDTLGAALPALSGFVRTMRVRREQLRAALAEDWSGATDLADSLVRRGLPFRESHAVVGRLVRLCQESGRRPEELREEELQVLSPLLDGEALAALDPERAVAARGLGERVAAQLELARRLLAARRAETARDLHPRG